MQVIDVLAKWRENILDKEQQRPWFNRDSQGLLLIRWDLSIWATPLSASSTNELAHELRNRSQNKCSTHLCYITIASFHLWPRSHTDGKKTLHILPLVKHYNDNLDGQSSGRDMGEVTYLRVGDAFYKGWQFLQGVSVQNSFLKIGICSAKGIAKKFPNSQFLKLCPSR